MRSAKITTHGPHTTDVRVQYGTNRVSLTLPTPNANHIDRFLKRNCALDLLDPKYDLKWDAKEISESEACLRAARAVLGIDPKREDVLAAVVGDGKHPRTGALIAFTTKWGVWSVDPMLDTTKKALYSINRLQLIPSKVQELEYPFIIPGWDVVWDGSPVRVLILPHSHAPVEASLDAFKPHHVVALPCCVPYNIKKKAGDNDVDIPPAKEYYDWSCLSGERHVKVWKNMPKLMKDK